MFNKKKKSSQNFDKMKQLIQQSGMFDSKFYTNMYPDVVASGQDPLEHFVRHGGREARSPSPNFDGPHYAMSNPEARLAENLLIDWIENGRKGSRVPPQPLASPHGQGLLGSDGHMSQAGKLNEVVVAPLTEQGYDLASKSGYFDKKYYLAAYDDVRTSGMDPLEHYLKFGWHENRNPGPLFDTQYVAATNMGAPLDSPANESPLLNFLKNDCKDKIESLPPGSLVLDRDHTDKIIRSELRIAIHIHLHYSEMIQDFLPYIQNFSLPFDLLLSTPTEADARFLRNFCSANYEKQENVIIRVTPNRGRDLAPFLVGFQNELREYDYVCHLHSKRSPHTSFGSRWLSWVLRSMFGESWIGPALIAHFEAHAECVMLYPDNFHEIKKFCGWAGNEARLKALLARFARPNAHFPDFPNFAAGSMAWFRGSFIADFAQQLSISDFEEEKDQLEGTLAHVLERAIPLTAGEVVGAACRYYLSELPPALAPEAYHGISAPSEPVGLRWLRDTPSIARHQPLALTPISTIFDEGRLNISWVIPDFALGAGGHMTIFRIVQFLELFGHHQTIWIQNAYNHGSPSAAKLVIARYYREIGANVHVRFLPDDVQQLSGDIIIATDCWTAFPVGRATNFKERFYFIQDFEPYFHPMGENYLVAESTYNFGFSALCAGNWLLEKATSFGMWARSWDLAVDKEFYYPRKIPRPPRAREIKRIVFYGRSYTPRRAVGLGIAAFEELARRRSDFLVQIFGEDAKDKHYSFPNEQMGILDPEALGELYRDADLGVSFSTTNYSLVPLEMIACELPVVEIDAPSARKAFPEGSVAFAAPSPSAVADAIERLLDDHDLRAQQRATAASFIHDLDWENSARAIEAAIKERLSEKGFEAVAAQRLCPALHLNKRRASVIIPTYNGGELFSRVLEAVSSQETDFKYDVLVIDSSSNDGTAEVAKNFGRNVRYERIEKADFQHGRTRNTAIGLTDGDVVAVLTQDALPQNAYWLRELVAPFAIESVAGVIGRHDAYPDHNAFLARDLKLMFDRIRDLGPLFSFDEGLASFLRPGSIEWRMMLHFYSDNNSAMRRSVWEKLPYPEIDWGEDQVWCWEILKLGLTKAYADKARVWHSHDSHEAEHVSASVSEGRMFAQYFGYHLAERTTEKSHLEQLRWQSLLYATSTGISLDDVDRYVQMQSWSHKGRAIGSALSSGDG